MRQVTAGNGFSHMARAHVRGLSYLPLPVT